MGFVCSSKLLLMRYNFLKLVDVTVLVYLGISPEKVSTHILYQFCRDAVIKYHKLVAYKNPEFYLFTDLESRSPRSMCQ